mgnify:CR=1 FL=1
MSRRQSGSASRAKPAFRTHWIWVGCALFAIGFIAAARWDLPLAHALYRPSSFFAIWMEALGWFPAFVPLMLLASLWLTAPKQYRKGWQVAAGAVALPATYGGIWAYGFRCFVKRGSVSGLGDPIFWVMAGAGLAVAIGAFYLVSRHTARLYQRLAFWAAAGALFWAPTLVVVQPVQLLWHRMRFGDMLASGGLHNFTVWFLPFGHGGSSFPSAHTANAAGILALVILCDLFPRWAKHRTLVYAACWAYIGLMAFARITMGRHFLSDTLAGAGIVALLLFLLRRTGLYRRLLKNVV